MQFSVLYYFTVRIDLNTDTMTGMISKSERIGDPWSDKIFPNTELNRPISDVKYRQLKGIVQRESAGVESCISWKVFLWHWTADIYIFLFKEKLLCKLQKMVSAALPKICGLSNSMGCQLQITVSGKPIQIHKWSSFCISRWKPVLWFVTEIGFPSHYLLIAEIGVPLLIHLNCSGRLIPAIGTIAASLFPLSAGWLTAISYLQRTPHWIG